MYEINISLFYLFISLKLLCREQGYLLQFGLY